MKNSKKNLFAHFDEFISVQVIDPKLACFVQRFYL